MSIDEIKRVDFSFYKTEMFANLHSKGRCLRLLKLKHKAKINMTDEQKMFFLTFLKETLYFVELSQL